MRLLFFLILFIFLGSVSKSQEYLPFPDSNAIWVNHHVNYEIQDPNPIPVITSEFYTKYCAPGLDTLIDTLSYTQIFYCGGDYKGALRDEMGKVYFIPTDSLHELLLYDFTVEQGDIVEVYHGEFYVEDIENDWYADSLLVYDVDSVLIDGQYRKQIYLEGSNWIEGIGNSYGLFNESWLNVSNFFNNLSCMSVNDTILYPSYGIGGCVLNIGISKSENEDLKLQVFPNPSNSKFNIEFVSNSVVSEIVVLNSFGQVVLFSNHSDRGILEVDLKSLADGIYFLKIEVEGQVYTEKLIKNDGAF